MNAIKNITIGHTERLYKPVGYISSMPCASVTEAGMPYLRICAIA